MPKISIIIPSWFTANQHGKYGEHETFKLANICMERMVQVTPKDLYELILIDNGSDTFENNIEMQTLVKKYWSNADILIHNDTNLGFGPAVNQGVDRATGEYIIQMNNDILVFKGWAELLLEAFEHKELDPPIGMSMPNLIKKEYQKDCLDERGKLDFYKVLTLPKEKLVLRNENIYEPHAEFGSTWCIKKELADRLIKQDGFFFDPQFLLGMSEDRDLYRRVRSLGYETYRINKTRVLHVGNLTIGKVPDHKKYTTENREKLKKKWNL